MGRARVLSALRRLFGNVQNWLTLKGRHTGTTDVLTQEEYVVYFVCCQRALMPTENVSVPDVLVRVILAGLSVCVCVWHSHGVAPCFAEGVVRGGP